MDERPLRAMRCLGMHVAHQTVGRQIPLIAQEFPEIADCHYATINFALQLPLIVAVPDYRTNPICWRKDNLVFRFWSWTSDWNRTSEVFDLVRIAIEVPFGGPPHDAWLYVAHNSPHRKTPKIHEAIAPFIDLKKHSELGIVIKRGYLNLPYKEGAINVIV